MRLAMVLAMVVVAAGCGGGGGGDDVEADAAVDAGAGGDAGGGADAGGGGDGSVMMADAASPDAAPDPCRLSYRGAGGAPVRTLGPVMAACPDLAAATEWQRPDGTRVPYPSWTVTERARLDELYQALLDDRALPLTCPDPTTQRATGVPATRASALYFSATQGFDLYAAQVAGALQVELGGLVPWSLHDLAPSERRWLLASDSLLSIVVPSQATEVPAYAAPGVGFQSPARRSNAPSYLCDPRDGRRVALGPGNLAGRSLLGASAAETLRNLTWWVASNVYHGAGATDAVLPAYGYSLRERLRPWPGSATGSGVNAVFGCQSAAHILSDLGRSVNLPLLLVGTMDLDRRSGHYLNRTHAGLAYDFGHATPLYLQHVDDLYALQDRAWVAPAGAGLFGTRATEQAALVAAKWQTRAQLEASGFTVAPDLGPVLPGVGVGVNGRGIYETYADYGAYLGAWRDGRSDAVALGFSSYAMGYWAEAQYQLCGAHLLREYCGPSDFATRLDVVFYGGALAADRPIVRTAADYAARSQACLAPVGGCAGLAGYEASWRTTVFGSAAGN
ncbi:MAG: hypothetical protein IT370_12995 [Deltaproteobacteria bacterium]|nr:hypothetical protein [Deltaproteobacteria bacterium]